MTEKMQQILASTQTFECILISSQENMQITTSGPKQIEKILTLSQNMLTNLNFIPE